MSRTKRCGWGWVALVFWFAIGVGLRAQDPLLKASATHDLVQGNVLNEDSQGVAGTLEFLDPATDLVRFSTPLDAQGHFALLLPKRQRFYFVIRSGCFTHYFKDDSHILETSTEDPPTTADLSFSIYQFAPGTEIVLGTLVFPSGASAILPGHEACLGQFAAYLAAHPTLQVQVTGHTDDVGNAEENRLLSKDRAVAVKRHLIDVLGVDPARLSAYGYGHTLPITTNGTETGRAINRRVSFIVIQP